MRTISFKHTLSLMTAFLFIAVCILAASADDNITPNETVDLNIGDNLTSNLNLTPLEEEIEVNVSASGGNISVPESENMPEPVVESSGIEYVEDAPAQIKSSPDGNPFAGQYATGGVSVNFAGSLMEGRGDGTNVSSQITFNDNTDVNGFIKTLTKVFRYESGTDL